MDYLNPKTDIEIYRGQCENPASSTTLPADYETCKGDELEIVEDITISKRYRWMK